MHFLDTCICVEFLRGRLRYGYQLMRQADPADFQLPSIVVAELWYGAEHSGNPERDRAAVDAFVGSLAAVPFDAVCAREYGRIRQLLGSEGRLIGDRDLMIAATALVHGATLVTSNLKEFNHVPGLALESWAEVDL